jgi:hypothetical protein
MVEVKGGAALEAALKRIAAAAKSAASVDIGFMGAATEADGTPIPLVAAMNEFGAPSRGQPPRPFMRQAIEKNSPKWPINLGTALVRYDYNASAALALVGLEIKEEIEDSIRELVSPPLAESTIARKSAGKTKPIRSKGRTYGPTKPLVDTGTMLRSVTTKVNTKG